MGGGRADSHALWAIGGVIAWWRTASALKSICRRLLGLLVLFYIDDTHLIERERSALGAKEAFREVMRLLGWSLDEKKATCMTT